MLEAHLAELLARSGVERAAEVAREIWLLSEGAISFILVHGDRGYAAAAARAAQTLLCIVRRNAPIDVRRCPGSRPSLSLPVPSSRDN